MQRNGRIRKVIVTMNMPLFAGKRKLEGILDYIGKSSCHWELQPIPAGEDFTTETLEQAKRDGADVARARTRPLSPAAQ